MLQFQCRKCGFQGPTLEGHRCVAAAPVAPTRLEVARAALAQVEERKEVMPLPTKGPNALSEAPADSAKRPGPKKGGFDRAAYQREYMRGWRARKKAGP